MNSTGSRGVYFFTQMLKVMVGLHSTRILEETESGTKVYSAEEWKAECARRLKEEPKAEEPQEEIELDDDGKEVVAPKRRGRPKKELIQEDSEEE